MTATVGRAGGRVTGGDGRLLRYGADLTACRAVDTRTGCFGTLVRIASRLGDTGGSAAIDTLARTVAVGFRRRGWLG